MASPQRKNITAVLEGGIPEMTPYFIYDWNMGAVTADALSAKMQEADWRRLIDAGLGIVCHCEIIQAIEHGVETTVKEQHAGADTVLISTKKTPIGDLRKITRNGWHQEDWIKTPGDYLIAKWIVDHTELKPRYDYFSHCESAVGDCGVTLITGSGNWTHRTPLMKINIDWAGTEQFCMDLAMEVPELFALYDSLNRQFRAEQKLIAAGPGRYVKWLENLTIAMIGPDRYRDYLMPVYEECVPILESGSKRVMVHYDGHLSAISGHIARAPFHMIESLTEPPEGDMSYERCRAEWPGKVLWGNLNAALYEQSAPLLRDAVLQKVRRAGKKGFALEVSEALPENWKESLPVVMEALKASTSKSVGEFRHG